MFKSVVCGLALALGAAAHADTVTWGPVSLSDDNVGAFILNATKSESGVRNQVLDLLLPNYSVSNFSSFLNNQVTMGVTATYDVGNIAGFSYEIFGSFDINDPGSLALFDFNSGTASGSINASSSGAFSVVADNSRNFNAVFNLAELGGTTAITELRITANLVPEPGSMVLSATALLALLAVGRRSARRRGGTAALLALGAVVGLGSVGAASAAQPLTKARAAPATEIGQMSSSGRMARMYRRAAAKVAAKGLALSSRAGVQALTAAAKLDGGTCTVLDEEDCGEDGYMDAPNGGQAELAIAVDPTGIHIVIGYNDTRGFSVSPISVSGVAYSDDGGLTFTDGGQLPSVATGTFSGTSYPQVFGDPDVKYVPGGAGCQFIYSSIGVVGQGTAPAYTGTSQTMTLHRSTDCGHTWQGPFEITAATRPELATDAADKEFIDVDPDTGRVMMSWTNFRGGTSTRIRTTFSDNIMTGTPPTWSTGVQLDATNVSGSVPRFAGNGSPNVYVAWSKALTASSSSVKFARSTNNGTSYSAPITVATFGPIDYILGNDRVHSFPFMAVDNSTGANQGNIYVVVSGSTVNGDGDILFTRSTNQGVSFSAPIKLDPNPGADRPQWFPHVSVDTTTGRVNVIFYDQSVATSGDLTDATWIYSDDGGVNWSKPTSLTASGCVRGTGVSDPLDCRPFRAGFNNNSGQPNLGDYIGSVSQNGTLYATYASNARKVLFTEQQPDGAWQSLDFAFKKGITNQAGLRPAAFTFVDSGGNGYADAGDQIRMVVPLNNFVSNAAIGLTPYTGISGTLSTTTPGVTVQRATVSYPNVASGATVSNPLEYIFTIAPSFVPGTPIELALNVTTAQGNMSRLMTLNTGTPVASTIFSEDFNATAPGALPAGWGTIHQGGNNTVPWTTSNAFCGTASNGLFHVNAEDGLSSNATRFERATSPNIVVPAASQYVTVEFDICTNTEDQLQYDGYNNILAYDGAHLRITDLTAGRVLLSAWVEAFADEFTTGTAKHFNKHAPRSSDTNYFQDISMWGGNSGGFKHVRMKFLGMQGSTFQLRPDYTQDSNGICTTPPCGVMMDNFVVKSVVTKSDELKTLSLTPVAGMPGVYTGKVTAQPIAAAGGITVNLSSSNPGITMISPSTVVIPAGSQTSPTFTVTLSPASPGTSVTITGSGPSNARTAGASIL